MKKLLTIIGLFLTTATYAITPMIVSRHLPSIEINGVKRQMNGAYYPASNRIEIHNRLKGEVLAYTLAHERSHWYEFNEMSLLERRMWNRALKREKYEPTKYCRETPVHKSEECFAESLVFAMFYNEYPPENTTQYRIIKKAVEGFNSIFNE